MEIPQGNTTIDYDGLEETPSGQELELWWYRIAYHYEPTIVDTIRRVFGHPLIPDEDYIDTMYDIGDAEGLSEDELAFELRRIRCAIERGGLESLDAGDISAIWYAVAHYFAVWCAAHPWEMGPEPLTIYFVGRLFDELVS